MQRKPGPAKGAVERQRRETKRDILRKEIAGYFLVVNRNWTVERAAEKLRISTYQLTKFIDGFPNNLVLSRD